MTNEWTLRRARPEDAADIAEILRAMQWFPALEGESVEQIQRRIRDMLETYGRSESHSIYVVHGNESDVVGYASVHWLPYFFLNGLEGFISELFVLEACRGQKIGNRLISAIKQEAEQRGCSRLHLVSGRTRESYKRQFYPKVGFEERQTIADFVMQI